MSRERAMVALGVAALLVAGVVLWPQRSMQVPPEPAATQPAATQPAAPAPAPAPPPEPVVAPTIPPPPAEQAPAQPPEYVFMSGMVRSRRTMYERILRWKSPGVYEEWVAAHRAPMTPEERRLALQQLSNAQDKQASESRHHVVDRLRGRALGYHFALRTAGSQTLADWVYERALDAEAALSGGPPTPEKTEALACMLEAAARLCEPMGYPDCAAATELERVAGPLCGGP